MAMQASGQIKLSEIAAEWGEVAPYSLSDFYAAAAGVPASGAIKFADFYGKSAQFDLAISSSTNNYDVYSGATGALY